MQRGGEDTFGRDLKLLFGGMIFLPFKGMVSWAQWYILVSLALQRLRKRTVNSYLKTKPRAGETAEWLKA